MADTSPASVDHVRYSTFSPPATFVSPVSAPSQITNYSNLEVAFTSGNSKEDHMLEKLPEKYTSMNSLGLVTDRNTQIAPLECLKTPQIRNAKSVQADLVQEPSSLISEAQVFDEISQTAVSSSIPELKDRNGLQTKVPTAMSDDTKGSHSVEEENSQDDVALLDNTPESAASGFLVPFAKQGTMMSNACSRLADIEYPFVDTLWLHTIPSWHNSLEEFLFCNQNGVLLCLGFCLHKCNWVDTGQKCNLPRFLSSNSRRCDSEEIIQEVLQEIVVSSSKQSPYTLVVRLLFALFGLVHKARLAWSYIVFDPGPHLDYVAIYAIDPTLGDGNSREEGAVTVLFEHLGGKFHIGQVLSVQIGITNDVCNKLGTCVCCHMGTCTYFHLEFDRTLWMVLFCSSVDNYFDTGQDMEVDPFVLLSVESEELTQVSHEKSWLLPIHGCKYILLLDENFTMAIEVSSENNKSVPDVIFLIEFENPSWASEFALIIKQPLLRDFQLVVLSCIVLNLQFLEQTIVEVVGVSNVSYSPSVICLRVQRDSLEHLSEPSSNEDMNYLLAHARNIYSQWGLGVGQLLEEMCITSAYCYGQLISKGADFIGTHTVVQLLTVGFQVTILDNFHNSVGESVASIRELVGPQLAQNRDVHLNDDRKMIFLVGVELFFEFLASPGVPIWCSLAKSTVTLGVAMVVHSMLVVTFPSLGMEYGAFSYVFWELTLVLHLRYMFGMFIVRKGEGCTFPLCLLIYRCVWINSLSSFMSRSTQLPYTSHDLRRNVGYTLRNTNALSSWDGIAYAVEALFVNHGNHITKLAFALHWFKNKEAWENIYHLLHVSMLKECFGTSADHVATLLLIKLTVPVDVHVYSNLEDKVLIGAGSIVMNGPRPILAKQPNITLSGYVWDPD